MEDFTMEREKRNDLNELLKNMSVKLAKAHTLGMFRKPYVFNTIFDQYDADKDGVWTQDEFERFLSPLPKTLDNTDNVTLTRQGIFDFWVRKTESNPSWFWVQVLFSIVIQFSPILHLQCY
ncbi:hypothetical protein BCR33DRAFT_431587 [Rhizoclosmatium globosum]|uniref:EF-hand domain-containing protein n=1 Tax=Rhizoclosmatium globosum TaxID=329046 RepID=A0A1Y2BWE0_9FUNG|nr:hypothetical protein BCR33DRAFT_431587 [Rhizoclosmatium globosum]|eukprot:ORY38445.1 hypothetical protein BCR33DRAFT_431587 [Rhizoclosmatium globosum]